MGGRGTSPTLLHQAETKTATGGLNLIGLNRINFKTLFLIEQYKPSLLDCIHLKGFKFILQLCNEIALCHFYNKLVICPSLDMPG